ncbi:transmembrane protein 241 [Sphaeramia orbicularis]|uniref:transmembrane protein 241 n=1 Tax=Sphaeramia orbicularis TaxID=375764 RepID=UPI00117D5B84|nr:transmembrane protein 241 [Sphaeramia orbicularis]
MQWKRQLGGLVFSGLFTLFYFTNKFVLSVLKFTFPTLFKGEWQTLIGSVLLLLSVKLGLVEMSRINRSAALSWLPGSVLFVGNIYAGSRALSRIDIPFFFTLQNSSHVVSYIILKVVHRERMQWLKLIRFCPYIMTCEQQCINYVFSVRCWPSLLHPTGDLMAALAFPSLQSYTFHCGCCARFRLARPVGFLLLLATVKLKSGLSVEHLKVWMFVAKVSAMSLSPFMFDMDMNVNSSHCVIVSHVGEATVGSFRERNLSCNDKTPNGQIALQRLTFPSFNLNIFSLIYFLYFSQTCSDQFLI